MIIYIYIYILKVYSCTTELIFNIKCSCLDLQILREKVQFWGVIILGQTTRGGPQKLNPCSWGEGQENDIY